jgi:hypothetical protein
MDDGELQQHLVGNNAVIDVVRQYGRDRVTVRAVERAWF